MNTADVRGLVLAGCDIRPLESGDLPAVLEIERRGYSHPWSEAVFRDCFRADYRLWALLHGGDLKGYAVISCVVDEAHLMNICVHPDMRGCGAGRYLLRRAIAEAVRAGMSRMLLEVRESNETAARLYEREGFEEIGRRPGYYPAGPLREDARVMALRFT